MDFTIEHAFPGITRDGYEELYFDEPFSVAMCRAVNVRRTLLRLDREAGRRLVRHVRIEPVRDIPAPIARLLGGRTFAYVEELDFDLGAGHGRWRVVPNVAADKVDCAGTLDFEETGGGVTRIVRGAITFSMFGIGGVVEKIVVAEVKKSYAGASDFTRRFLAEREGRKG